MRKFTSHENTHRTNEIKVGSEKSFGLVFAAVFIIIALFPVLGTSDQETSVRLWALIVAALFAVIAMTKPQLLAPLNNLWFRFGLLLHRIVNPLVMGLLFFLTVTPIGLLMRMLGKVPLKLKFEKDADSYWIARNPPGPAPDSMKRQF